ncbi:MAG: DUF2752 domain-containing protein [Myxococcota bacterium]|nr:DUF2752 domain-containing protein [Myxococcota bacterium]
MNDSRSQQWEARITGFVMFIPSAIVLGIARYLEADHRGFGTHQQLGLGGCTFLDLTTLPCPMCGMTTTFTHMAHLNFYTAICTQPFGVVLYLITVSICIISLLEIIYPNWILSKLKPILLAREGLWFAMLLIGMGSGWIYKILSMKIWI